MYKRQAYNADKHLENYLLARRSLRIWPKESCDFAGFAKFAGEFLKLSDGDDHYEALGPLVVSKCRNMINSARKDKEFVVCFDSVADRDFITSGFPHC